MSYQEYSDSIYKLERLLRDADEGAQKRVSDRVFGLALAVMQEQNEFKGSDEDYRGSLTSHIKKRILPVKRGSRAPDTEKIRAIARAYFFLDTSDEVLGECLKLCRVAGVRMFDPVITFQVRPYASWRSNGLKSKEAEFELTFDSLVKRIKSSVIKRKVTFFVGYYPELLSEFGSFFQSLSVEVCNRAVDTVTLKNNFNRGTDLDRMIDKSNLCLLVAPKLGAYGSRNVTSYYRCQAADFQRLIESECLRQRRNSIMTFLHSFYGASQSVQAFADGKPFGSFSVPIQRLCDFGDIEALLLRGRWERDTREGLEKVDFSKQTKSWDTWFKKCDVDAENAYRSGEYSETWANPNVAELVSELARRLEAASGKVTPEK